MHVHLVSSGQLRELHSHDYIVLNTVEQAKFARAILLYSPE